MFWKKLIVNGLERACDVKDVTLRAVRQAHIPYPERWDSCYWAGLSSELDEKWGTGQWKKVEYSEEDDDE